MQTAGKVRPVERREGAPLGPLFNWRPSDFGLWTWEGDNWQCLGRASSRLRFPPVWVSDITCQGRRLGAFGRACDRPRETVHGSRAIRLPGR